MNQFWNKLDLNEGQYMMSSKRFNFIIHHFTMRELIQTNKLTWNSIIIIISRAADLSTGFWVPVHRISLFILRPIQFFKKQISQNRVKRISVRTVCMWDGIDWFDCCIIMTDRTAEVCVIQSRSKPFDAVEKTGYRYWCKKSYQVMKNNSTPVTYMCLSLKNHRIILPSPMVTPMCLKICYESNGCVLDNELQYQP